MSTKSLAKAAFTVCIAILAALVAGCNGSHSGQGAAEASSAKGAVASVTADPTVAAELDQAKRLVKSCFPAAPLDQARTIHLVFLSSAAGKNGPAVTTAREKLSGCLGIPQGKRGAFENDAIIAAEHQTPKILSAHPAAGVERYLEVTLPQLVLKYKGTAAGVTGGASIPGTSASPAGSPSPSVKASS